MLSSDKNVETIAQLIEVLKHYLGLQTEYLKLDVIDKVVRLLKHHSSGDVFLIRPCLLAFQLYGHDDSVPHRRSHPSADIFSFHLLPQALDREAPCSLPGQPAAQ